MKKKLSKLVFLLQKWNCKIAFHINHRFYMRMYCLLYTSDAADEL